MNENRRLEGNSWLILTRVKTAISTNLRRKCMCPKMCRRQSALSFAGRETIPPAKGCSTHPKLGRAPRRDRVCPYVKIPVGAVSLHTKIHTSHISPEKSRTTSYHKLNY